MLYPLLIAHLLGDFALQPDWMIRIKKQWGTWGVLPHIGIITLLTFLAVLPALSLWWPYCVIIVLSHLLIDIGKVTIDDRVKSRSLSLFLFLTDQALHCGMIVWMVVLAQKAGLQPIWNLTRQQWDEVYLLVLVAFVVGILLRVFAPGYGWPNRWPATFARAGTLLLVAEGIFWLSPIPVLLALKYHQLRGQTLTRAVWVESLGGAIVATLCGLLFWMLYSTQ
ncbi:MAG: DUF3307 domain-containing protein [Ardenticatenales bacterium]|nr:DUF3307 domain-containing protein [Ardenticatenales bacterium]